MTDTTALEVPVINTELFAKVRDVIDADPGRHDQRDWQNCAGGIAIQIVSGGSARTAGSEASLRTPPSPRLPSPAAHRAGSARPTSPVSCWA